MKKLFLTFAVVFMAIAANAQVWMGGSFGFNVSKDNPGDKPVYLYSIAPEIGYSIAPRWDVAVGLGYAGSYSKDVTTLPILGDITTIYSESEFSVEPYVRYTIFDLGKVGFFVDCGVKYTTGKETTTANGEMVPGYPEKSTCFFAGLQPGIKYAASDKITFAARIGSLGYNKTSNKFGESSIYGVNVANSAFTLGFWWAF